MMSKKLLFVDDEPRILEALRDLLRSKRKRWQMEFALGGESAIERLANEPFDIVITDLRMPGIDGFALLDHLKAKHPAAVRIVLSGDAERDTAMKVLRRAHRALSKPCPLPELEGAIESACVLHELVSDPLTRRAVGAVGQLPQLPRTYESLVAKLEDDNATPADLAKIIGMDIAASAKVLQIANSPLFGGGRSSTSVVQAITVLGVEALKTIVLSASVFEAKMMTPENRKLAEELHDHSSLIAALASEIAPRHLRRDAFAAGMLHDVGRLLMSLAPGSIPPPAWGATVECEDGSNGHARVGAYLLGLWGLPAPIINAVARHHEPATPGEDPVLTTVRVAENVAKQLSGAPSTDELSMLTELARAEAQRAGIGIEGPRS